mmetsp:Transcript_1432/g.3234  ORF Transcript_1432/g.3234 Transcript_1432/m.3234 type:complete len:252 (+) Transcript_1432:129-884(+)
MTSDGATSGPHSGDVELVIEGKSFFEHSVILSSSPVFDAMLRSDMQEGLTKRVKLDDKSKTEYLVFRSFLQPVTGRSAVIDETNVDFLLTWFHCYQIAPLIRECEVFLLKQPVSVDRLLQAKTFHLKEQYGRCLATVADNFATMPQIEVLAEHAEIMRELLPLTQKALMKQNQNILSKFDEFIPEPEHVIRSALRSSRRSGPIWSSLLGASGVSSLSSIQQSDLREKLRGGLLTFKNRVEGLLVREWSSIV